MLVTHDFDDVVRLATDVLMLEHGRRVAGGPLSSVTSRPDLAFLRDAVGLGSVFDALVSGTRPERGLAELSFGGGVLLVGSRGLVLGTTVRARIPAREVILASSPPEGLSLHNVLAGEVSAVHVDPAFDHVVVQLEVGQVRLLAEVTKDAVTRLNLAVGRPVHALIKSVSIEL